MKEELIAWLHAGDFAKIEERAAEQKRILSTLTGLTYDPDALIGWRAVQALGMAARVVADKDAEYVRVHLRRLSWLVNDESGGIGWRAPEAMGEILARSPAGFEEFIPPLFHLLELEEEDAGRFRAGVLWAIGRVCSVRPEHFPPIRMLVLACLDDPDTQARGMALWALYNAAPAGMIPHIQKHLDDTGLVELYQDGELRSTSVAELAEAFLLK